MHTFESPLRRVREWHGVDRDTFHEEIVPAGEPAVLKGLVAHWPAVRASRESREALSRYLTRLDSGIESQAVLVPPEHGGRMFYGNNANGFNFLRSKRSVSQVLEQLARYAQFQSPPSVALQCASIADCLPGFGETHPMPLLDADVQQNLWMGNAFLTPAHIDELDNLACVVAGRRRFTLFPPGQVGNLYIGPFEHTPAGAPVSLAPLKSPDLARFPRMQTALENALVADLEPGDTLFLPAVWWHHVESFDALNILVNYWWEQPGMPARAERVAPTRTLMHALLSMRHLPDAHRRAWGEIFSHFVFSPEADDLGHIPPELRGALGKLPPERVKAVLSSLLAAP
jgi:hypothetical protein